MQVPLRLKNSKVFRDYVGKYGIEVTKKYVLPLAYDIIGLAKTSNRKNLHMNTKRPFDFSYLLNDIDIFKGRLRLRGDVNKRIRTFYYNAMSRKIDIPVFMGHDRMKGELQDTGQHIFIFHKRIKNLTDRHNVKVIVGFSGIELRVA